MAQPQDQDGLTRAMALALRDLAGEGCFGTRALRQDYISLAASKRGVTLAVGHVKASVCERLVLSGWAEWRGVPDKARLVLTDAGRGMARKVMARLPKELAEDVDVEERVVGTTKQAVMVDRRESPLAWLARRKGADGKPLIDPACFAAGERLRADFERTGLSPRVTMDWGRFGAGSSSSQSGGGTLSDAMISARQRMEQALEAVGADMAGVLVDICCYLKGPSAAGRPVPLNSCSAWRLAAWPRITAWAMKRAGGTRARAFWYGPTRLVLKRPPRTPRLVLRRGGCAQPWSARRSTVAG